MQIIGLDPGSRYTGYGIIEKDGKRLRHVSSGRINATRGVDFADRLRIIYDGLTTVLEQWPCQEAAVETIFTARNAMSSLKLGHARGVSLLALQHAGLPLSEYPPATVKSAVGGHGRASKAALQTMVKQLLKIDADLTEDASDALAVAICHSQTVDFKRRLG